MKSSADQSFAAFVGIDWGDQKHDVCLKAAGSDAHEHSVIVHRPEAIECWALGLRQRFAGQPIAVCLEIARGPLVSALQRHEFLVLFPVNPSTLAGYRSTFCVSGAKDDPTDAELALEMLLRHPERLCVLRPQSAAMRKLERLVQQRRTLVDEVRRVTNRMTAALKEYFPQVVEWFKDKDTYVFCDFVSRWPTLKQAQRARKARLQAFFHEHNVRYGHIVERRVQSIMAASPLTDDPSVVGPNSLMVISLAQQLRVLLQAVERFDAEIAVVAPTLADYELFAGLPGAGAVFAPRLLVAFGEQRERFDSANRMQSYAGVAPVTQRSGNKCWVHWRLRCPKFVRQTFVEWAAHSIPYCYWAEAYYRQQRAKGSSRQAALRALAFKWIRIVYRCWQTGTPYDEATYLSALKRRGSPLMT
ncbi:MAG TPA: IS110 family transposase [Burkholderiales bacterium]|nr:IS110 family transposase [Burkholderiales bacterium]